MPYYYCSTGCKTSIYDSPENIEKRGWKLEFNAQGRFSRAICPACQVSAPQVKEVHSLEIQENTEQYRLKLEMSNRRNLVKETYPVNLFGERIQEE